MIIVGMTWRSYRSARSAHRAGTTSCSDRQVLCAVSAPIPEEPAVRAHGELSHLPEQIQEISDWGHELNAEIIEHDLLSESH